MIHRRYADNTSEQSLATRLRRQRFQILLDMLADLPRPVTILDIGGRQTYWEMMMAGSSLGDDLQIIPLNVEAQTVSLPNFTLVSGDGRAMPRFRAKQFDIVFSNSTIEHLGTFENQRQMAEEVRRVGKRYYVQTPNRYFPVEPHFLFPAFQFLPVAVRVWLLRHCQLGWYSRIPDRRQALREVASIRLLTKAEMKRLFPEARLFEERFLGLVKSFVAYTP
jgi:hypothetical protein